MTRKLDIQIDEEMTAEFGESWSDALTREDWEELQKAIAGDPGDPDVNSQAMLDQFFSGLMQTFIDAVNSQMHGAGQAASDAASKELYSPSVTFAQNIVRFLDRASALTKSQLSERKGMWPLDDDEDKPVHKSEPAPAPTEGDYGVNGRVSKAEDDPALLSLFDKVAKEATRSFYRHALVLK